MTEIKIIGVKHSQIQEKQIDQKKTSSRIGVTPTSDTYPARGDTLKYRKQNNQKKASSRIGVTPAAGTYSASARNTKI